MTEISGLLRAVESNVAYVTDEESYYLRIFYLRIPNYFMLQYLEAWRKFLVLKGGTNRPDITVQVDNAYRRKVSKGLSKMVKSG